MAQADPAGVTPHLRAGPRWASQIRSSLSNLGTSANPRVGDADLAGAPVGVQLVKGVSMSTDLSLFGHMSRPHTMARPASFWRMASRGSIPQFGVTGPRSLGPL
jgi:hypothetical protein